MLWHKAVIQRKNGSIGNVGQSVCNGTVAPWAADRPGAAAKVENPSPCVGPRGNHPLGFGSAALAEIGLHIQTVSKAVHMLSNRNLPRFSAKALACSAHFF